RPNVSRTIPTANETTTSRTATITGEPPMNRLTALVMGRGSDQPAARASRRWPQPPAGSSKTGPDLSLIDQVFGNCTTEDFGCEAASPSPPTSLPLIVRRPCEALSLIVEPSLISPASSICASGSCTHFWITRFNGRAP